MPDMKYDENLLEGATAGDISASGKEIIIKSYTDVFYWCRDPSTHLVDVLKMNYTLLNYIVEPKGDAIAWDYQESSKDPDGYFTISETTDAVNESILYYYTRIPSDATSEACLTYRSYPLSLLFVMILSYCLE